MKINTGSQADYIDQDRAGNSTSFLEEHASSELACLDFAPSQLEITYTNKSKGRLFPKLEREYR